MIRPMKIEYVLMVLVISFAVQAHASSDVAARGKDLIAQASAKMNIFDLPTFRMSANVRIDNFGKPLDGTYSLLWNGPDQWREEITFPSYSEIQVGKNGMLYVKRSADHTPYRVFQLRSALGFSWRANSGPSRWEKIKKVREEKIAGQKMTCVQISGKQKYTRKVCINPASGLLTRSMDGIIESDVLPVGSKLFPRSISLLEKDRRVVELTFTAVDSGEHFTSALFEPPSGAVSRPGCVTPTPVHQLQAMIPSDPGDLAVPVVQGTVAAMPKIPVEDGVTKPEGSVAVYAFIDESGTPQNLHVVLSANPGLDRRSVEEIGKWRYEPATCNGKPVAVETVVTVNHLTVIY